MKKVLTIITCDLCGFVNPTKDVSIANPKQTMFEVHYDYTDFAGHTETIVKDICEECRQKIRHLIK